MTPGGVRERPAAGIGLGLALALVLPWLALDLAANRAGAADTSTGQGSGAVVSRAPRVPTIYHKSRNFRIPFNVEPADRVRLKEVQLFASKDSGYNWSVVSKTSPDHPAFTYRAARDGEYWFAVRTMDTKGQLYPGSDEEVEPSMKVVVDTTPPRLTIESEGRRGSLAAVRWDVRDEHLDLKSLIVEYQVEGGRDWRQIPIKPTLLGETNWDAGTVAPLKVRASVEDKAHNVTEAVITLPEGTPENPGVVSNDPLDLSNPPPPVSQISSGPTFPSLDESPASPNPAAAVPVTSAPESPSFGGAAEPFGGSSINPAGEPPSQVPASSNEGGSAPGGLTTLLVPKPQFPLKYEVQDPGPDGRPATVELWVTQDGGRTWFPKGTDPDCTSPFPVDLGGEGTFGLRLVALGASGLGDPRPAPGDPPDVLVEVDSTPPTVQMLPPQIGTGPNLGKVVVRWRASDTHMHKEAVVISWRPDQPGSQWIPITPRPVANIGSFTWTVPPNVPAKFHLRVDVQDTALNRSFAETTEGPPVYVDRTRPRSKIIGLDRAGAGPSVRAFR